MRTPHTSTYKGKRVFIRTKTCTVVDKFSHKTAHYVFLEVFGKFRIKDIRVFKIYKGAQGSYWQRNER